MLLESMEWNKVRHRPNLHETRDFGMFTVTTLFILLIVLMGFNTILLNQCLVGDQRKYPIARLPAENQFSDSVTKLSVVIPYTAENRRVILDSLQRWQQLDACVHQNQNAIQSSKRMAELVFYVNKAVQAEDRTLLTKAKQMLGHNADCFSNIRVMSADLSKIEDEYPAGPSNMFFKIFQDSALKGAMSSSTHMFWMEHDVIPIRSGWVDALMREAGDSEFWVSGSMYMGGGLDSAVQVSDNWNWVGHINGNALYSLRDDAFDQYLQLVVQYEPPNHFWKPFDVSIWKVLHAFPYTWPVYQQYRSKFQHSAFIHHWGFHITENDIALSSSQTETYLLHGANISAGNLLARPKPPPPDVVWSDQLPKSARLSVMIRSFVPDLLFCHEAVMSALKYIPNALEFVLVVHKPDFRQFKRYFNSTFAPKLRIVAEETIIEDQHMQQKWSKLHADKYCEGDLILHLDSDAVFHRELQLRDIVWLGKPILAYQRYETLDPTFGKVMWKNGTSFALGDPVNHEFSRSPLRVYPRQLYPAARKHLESVHNTRIEDFLQTREAKHEVGTANETMLFSDFNYLGAYAWRHARHLVSLAPMDSEEKQMFLLPPPIISSPVCQGNARLAHNPTLVKLLLKALRETWMEGLPCNRIPDLALPIYQHT